MSGSWIPLSLESMTIAAPVGTFFYGSKIKMIDVPGIPPEASGARFMEAPIDSLLKKDFNLDWRGVPKVHLAGLIHSLDQMGS